MGGGASASRRANASDHQRGTEKMEEKGGREAEERRCIFGDRRVAMLGCRMREDRRRRRRQAGRADWLQPLAQPMTRSPGLSHFAAKDMGIY